MLWKVSVSQAAATGEILMRSFDLCSVAAVNASLIG
jgi:hypothetical protein